MVEKNTQIQILRQQASEYAMAFDLLKKVANSETEEKALGSILETFEILFSPQEVLYLALKNGQPGEIYSSLSLKKDCDAGINCLEKYNKPYSWTDSENGFYVKIIYKQKELGVLEVIGLALPEQKEHYLNLTLSMMDVCGLAIENAKRYQKLKDAEINIRQEKERLEEALSQVKRLSGLLPICGHCKKIRDDKGYWNQIDSYIQENSEAVFSHGICQECAKIHYPDFDIYDETAG